MHVGGKESSSSSSALRFCRRSGVDRRPGRCRLRPVEPRREHRIDPGCGALLRARSGDRSLRVPWQWGASPPRARTGRLPLFSPRPSRSSDGGKRGFYWNAFRPPRSRSGCSFSRSPPQMDLAFRGVHRARRRRDRPGVEPIRPGPHLGASRGGRPRAWYYAISSSRPRRRAWGPLDGSGVNWDAIPFLALTGATASRRAPPSRLRPSRDGPQP